MIKKLKFNQLITIISLIDVMLISALIYLYFYLLKNFFNTEKIFTDYLKPNIILIF